VAVTVGPIAQHIKVVDHFLAEAKCLAVWNAECRIGGQNQDSGVVVAQAQFARTAQHAVAADSEDRLGFDRTTVGHHRSGRGQREDVARLHVERAAPHMPLDAVASVDKHAVDLRRVGVPLGTQHLSGDDASN